MKSNKKLKVVSLTTLAAACVLSGVFALNANTAAAAEEDKFHEVGASIRVSSKDKGIRFAFGLLEDYTGEDYEIGTLIIPKEVLGANELKHNDDKADETDETDVDYLLIPCTKNFLDNATVKGAKDDYKYYNVALTEIPDVRYNTVLVARSYYKNANGEYVYSDVVERSIGYVASAVLNSNPNAFDKETKETIEGIVDKGFGNATVEVDFEKDLLSVNDTTTFEVTNTEYKAVWSSSNEEVATVDKDGNVKAVKGGETTITAKIGNKTASQEVYVVGNGLYSDQIGIRIYGNDLSGDTNYLNVTSGDNGEMDVKATFKADATYAPALIFKKVFSKNYFEQIDKRGYTKLTFNLAVEGEKDELYVFGKPLASFPENNGVYSVTIDVYDTIVYYHKTISDIATLSGKAGQSGSFAAKFIAWKSPANDYATTRNYVFTLSNVAFVGPTLSVDFAEDNTDLVAVGKTTTLIANTNFAGEVAWSSSKPAVATVENGVVTGVTGGVATITATFEGISVEKTVYVVGGLNSDQIGVHAYGWNQTANSAYFNMATDSNGKMVATAKIQGDEGKTYGALTLLNLEDKAYYEKLLANGYTKLTFTLGVGGADAASVSDLYVFGKKLTTFAKNANGAYAVVVDLQYLVDNFAKTSKMGTGVKAEAAELNYMFLAWKTSAWTARNYVFTFSNVAFRQGVLFADNIGMRVNGWNMTTNTTYMTMDLGANGEMIITANWQAYTNYGPALVLKNLEDKAYYQNLQNNGYTYLTFDLKVEGEDADKLTDVHILGTAQKVAECEKVDGVYKVKIQLAHIIQFYDTISTLDTSGNQAGQWGSRSAMLLAWRFSTNFATVPEDATRNYVFTISNSAYTKA